MKRARILYMGAVLISLVGAICVEEDSLRIVGREIDIPGGTHAERLLGDEYFFYERAVLLKDLDTVVSAVADVH